MPFANLQAMQVSEQNYEHAEYLHEYFVGARARAQAWREHGHRRARLLALKYYSGGGWALLTCILRIVDLCTFRPKVEEMSIGPACARSWKRARGRDLKHGLG